MKNNKTHISLWALIAIMLLSWLPINAKQLSEEDNRKFDYFFIEACRLKMHNEYQKAAEMFKSCLELNESSAVAHFELGKILLMAGDDDNAIRFLSQAVVLNRENEWYQVYLAGVFEHSQRPKQAIAIYEGLRKNNPSKLEYYYHLGDLYTKSKQYIKAAEIYNAIEEQEGMDEALVMEKQRLYLLAGEKKKALGELKRLTNKYPNDVRYLIYLGDYYINTNNLKNAKKTLDKAKALDEDYGFLHLSLSHYHDRTNNKTGSHNELKKAFASDDIPYEQKMQMLLQVTMLTAKDSTLAPMLEQLMVILTQSYPEEASTYFFYANYLLEDTARNAETVENLLKTVELDSNNEEAWSLLIQLALEKNDFQQVVNYTDEALLNGQKSTFIYFYRGVSAQQLKDYKTAQEAFSAAIGVTPDENEIKPQLYGSLADIHYELKEANKAFEFYEKALELDEHNILALNNYAYYLSEKDTLLAKAESMSAKCIQLEPGNPTYLDTYAWILYKRNNLVLAKFYMEKAISNMDGQSDILYDHYADILHANGDNVKALEFFQKAIDAGGDEALIRPKMQQE